MRNTIKTEKIPIKLWLDDIEEGALRQAKNLANFPFGFHHIAIMPDAHEGYGMPIGGVMATKEVVVPNAVGVDIGCGVCAVKTPLTEISIVNLKEILGEIRRQIPVGFEHHKKTQEEILMPLSEIDESEMKVVAEQYKSALKQIGTLGGGNHFIEIQRGLPAGRQAGIWIMLHSGSRNIGKRVADYYNRLAIKLNRNKIPKEWQLAYLYLDSQEGKNYLKEMQYCVDFALANRKLMLQRVVELFCNFFELKKENFGETINIAHNYAVLEEHFGEKVMVHRKGATLAEKDVMGIVPGSQGSKSYIVKGLGNEESFKSCSHGAGRKMSRKEAQRSLDLEEEAGKLDKKGVLHAIRGKRDLDEAPSAYRNIDLVMKNQQDLVEILVELEPLAVVKG